MRKVIHLLLTGLTIVVLTACGGSSTTTLSGITEVVEDIAGNANGTPATAAQINSIPGVDGAVEGVDYSAALAAETYADPENPTADEIQAVVDAVNSGTPANQDVGAVTDSNAAANTAAENAAVGAVVGITAQATDPDSADTVTYTLTDDASGLFAINGTSGVVTVAAGLDYETATTHSITVLATSSDSSTSSAVVTIAVTNVVDTVATLANSTATIGENAADGDAVGTVTISDNGDSAITDINLSGTGAGNFAVATDGAITVAAGASLDFETTPSYSLTAVATNGAGDSASVTVDITIIDTADIVATLANSTGTVAEDAADGAAVGTVTISDTGDAAITAITLSGTGAANFAVATDGAITVAAGASLDFETTATYNLTAVATNGAGESDPVNVTITVSDVADVVPTLSSFSGNVEENATVGTVVGTVSVTNSGDTAITAFTLSDSTNFEINASGTIKTKVALDFETTTSYSLTATATNTAGNSAPVNVTITVNDIADVLATLEDFSGSVDENVTIGTTVGSITITDNGDSNITAITLSGANNGDFEVATDGNITVAASLDHETTETYNLTAVATNSAGDSASVNVTITVNDVNEDVGAVTDINGADGGEVREDATSGTEVGITAEATDPDDSNNTVTYALTDTSSGRFEINATTGVVTVSFNGEALNSTIDKLRPITVLATSSDGSSSSATMTILVTNEVDEPTGYGVISYNGHQWLDRNIGATVPCTTAYIYASASCVGDYYQWGRLKDGHEQGNEDSNSSITDVLSASSNPGHGDFIITDLNNTECETNPCNWINYNETDLWQVEGNTTAGDNGVCPAGWRVPTKAEFETLGITDAPTGLNASNMFARIRLHTSDYRNDENGLPVSAYQKANGYYWTSTVTVDEKSYAAWIDDGIRAVFGGDWGRANGFQIRCIKDVP